MPVWHQSIINYSKIIEEGIMKFLENNSYEWMKRNTAPTSCKRSITSNFYATVKKLTVIKIDIYPNPIIFDEATTEGEYFVKAISPGDDSGCSSSGSSSSSSSSSSGSGSSSSSSSSNGKKRKLKN